MLSLTMAFSNTFEDLGKLVEEVESEKKEQKVFLLDIFKQRMRTQLMARDTLLLNLNFEGKRYAEELMKTGQIFDTEMKKILSKKEEMEAISLVVPDYKKRILRLKKTWEKFYQSIHLLLKSPKDETALTYIVENNVLLLTDIDFILRKYMAFHQSSNRLEKALQHKSIMRFSQMGVPRAYIQKIMKEKLLIYREIKTIENRQNLNITIHSLGRLLKAFRDGDKTLDLLGISETNFLKKLSEIDALWRRLEPLYRQEVFGQEELQLMLQLSDAFMVKHTELVQLSTQIDDQ